MPEDKKQFYSFDTNQINKKIVNIPDYVVSYKRKQFLIHTIIAIIIGVSVPYFLFNFTYDAFVWVKDLTLSGGRITLSSDTKESKANLGSDDIPLDDDIPRGGEVPVNPNLKGQYYFLGPNYKVPNTSALSYVVSDVDTGEVIIEKNSDMILPIASISKLITALVAKQNMDMHSSVVVSRSSIDTYGTTGGLRVGEKILVTDLFYPLLMESSNDAAEVLAESYGEDAFIKKMNEKAKELGMTNTSFFEPSGLSFKNVSTAHDLQILVEYITKNHPEIWDITRVRQYAIKGHSWGNGSALSRKSNFLGGKNGFTYEAHRTTASIFEIPIGNEKKRISVTLLKSNERESDVDALLRFLTKWVGYLPEGEEL